jgi:hypothetical protein
MAELNFGLLTPPGSQSIGNAFVSGMDQAAVSRARENQNALSQYTLAKAKREDQLTNQMLAGMQGADTIEKQADVLRRGGKYREANELINAGLDRQIKLGTLNAQPGTAARVAAQTARDRQQWEGQALRDLGNNPSDDNIRALGQDAVIKGIYTQEEADQKVAQFLAIPLADRAANFSQYGAPAAAPEATSQDIRTMQALGYPNTPAGYAAFREAGAGRAPNTSQDIRTMQALGYPNTPAGYAAFREAGAGRAPNTSQDIRTMQALGYPNTPAGYAAFREAGAGRAPNTSQDIRTMQALGYPNTPAGYAAFREAGAGRAPNTTHTNVQPDGQGGHVGLNTKTGRMEQIPQDDDVVAGGVLSGDALELAAQGYLMNGKFPTNLGRGKQGAMNTIRIMERAAALANESGMPAEETAINQIAGKAKSVALTQIVKDLAAIRPYNAMLEKNGDIAISLAEKAISTNAKLANRPINWLKQNASDNPDVAEFLAQARIVTTEAARVLNNPRLVGQLTDSARREMEAILNGDMPLESFTRVVRRLQSDGKNRVDAMVAERDSLKQSIRRPNAAGQSTAPAAAMNIPQAAINDLKAGRGTPEQFDEQFGAGAAARVQGAK